MRWQLPGWSTSSPALLVLALAEPVRQYSAWRFSLTAEHIIRTEESQPDYQSLQVTDKDKKGQGGGIAEEGEFIDVVEMGVEEVGMSTMQKKENITLRRRDFWE